MGQLHSSLEIPAFFFCSGSSRGVCEDAVLAGALVGKSAEIRRCLQDMQKFDNSELTSDC